jgi:hypothetical protein
MSPREPSENPLLVVAYGVAIALGIAAVGLALKWIIPVLFASIASAVTMATASAASGLFSPVVIQIGVGVMITTGVTTTLTLVVKAVKDAPNKPYEWTAGFAALIQPIALDFVKEFQFHLTRFRELQTALSR